MYLVTLKIIVLVCVCFVLIITPTYSVEVKNKIAGPLLDKVNSKPLVKADPWGKCRWARTNKNIGAKMGEIVKDRTACMDYSNKRCMFDRLTGGCITKTAAEGHNTDVLLSNCVKRCTTRSCKNRCKEQNYAERDDSNDREPEYDANGGVEALKNCLSACVTRSCRQRCQRVGYLSESTKNSRTYKVSKLKLCISKCVTRSCKSRCQETDYNSVNVVKDELETDRYLDLKVAEAKRGYNKRDMKKFITKKTKRCYKVCMVEFGKKQKCLKTCGIKNRSKCKFSRDGLHDIRNLNEFVCE